jgi:hypothetical protein
MAAVCSRAGLHELRVRECGHSSAGRGRREEDLRDSITLDQDPCAGMTILSLLRRRPFRTGVKVGQAIDDEGVNLIREAETVFRFCKSPVQAEQDLRPKPFLDSVNVRSTLTREDLRPTPVFDSVCVPSALREQNLRPRARAAKDANPLILSPEIRFCDFDFAGLIAATSTDADGTCFDQSA